MKPIASVLLSTLLLVGCAPLPFTVASMLADGVSYATTSKSLTDHGLSALSERDCAMHRLLTDGIVCRDIDGDIVASDATIETLNLAPVPQQIATRAGNVAVSHLGSISDPIPGVYMVIASSRDLLRARTFSTRSTPMMTQVFAMPAGGRRAMYHVVAGPITQNDYSGARKTAANNGFPNTWALKIDDDDWRLAMELEARERQRVAAERNRILK